MLRMVLSVLVILAALLTLTACSAGAASNADGSVSVEVTLNDFTIESSTTQFQPGVLYHFTVTNRGQVGHEFMILPVSAIPSTPGTSGMSGMSMEAYDTMALMMIPIDQLPAGATATADYTFAGVPQGDLELVCLTPGHYEAGMHIPITVK